MKTITFYSYKGGVGRSLALANIATRLAEFGKRVCLLDFDLEAPGLHYKFADSLGKQKIEIEKGIVDYIHKFSNEGRLSGKISDYAYPFFNFSLSATTSVETILIPAGNTDSPEYWKKLSSINWNNLLFENTSGIGFLLNLKERVRNEFSPDYFLIDSRTGVSEMSGVTLSLLADDVVILAANNRENIAGVKKIMKSISDPSNNIFGKVPKITFVLSRIPFTTEPSDKAREQTLIAMVERELDQLIDGVNVIHSDRELEEEEQIKIGRDKDGIDPIVSLDYLKLFDKLTEGDFSSEQITFFKKIKESERQLKRAISENTIVKKLEYINKAIELNSGNKDFFFFRATIYEQLRDRTKVLEDCEQAIYLDTNNIKAYELKGRTLLELKDYSGAKSAFEKILGSEKDHLSARLGLAEICIHENEYDKAISYYNDVIKIDGENAAAYTGRAMVKLLSKSYLAALDDLYQALSYNAEDVNSFAILAEINIHLNNKNEFYLNLERAIKLDDKWVEAFIKARKLHAYFINDKRFSKLIEKYDLHLENGIN